MKKLSIVLSILLVAALIFGGVTLSQKGDLQKKADTAAANVTDLQKKADQAAADVADLQAKLDAAAAENGELQTRLTTLTEETDAAKASAEEALNKAAEDAKAAAEEAAAAFQAQLNGLTEEGSAIKAAAEEAAAKAAEELAAVKAAAEESAAQAAQDLANVKADAEAALTKAVDDAKAAAAQELENAKAGFQAQVDALAGEKEELQGKLEQAAADLTAAKADAEAALTKAVDDAKAAAAQELENAKAGFQAQVDALTGEKEELQGKLEQAAADLTAAKADAEAALTKAVDDAKAAAGDDLTAAKADAEAALTKAVDDAKAAAGDELAAVKAAAEEAAAKAAEELAAAKADAEAAVTKAVDDAKAAAAQELEEAKAALQTQVDALTGEKAEADKALEAAAATIATLETKAKDLTKLVSTGYAGKTVILHSNDVHGEIAGYAYIASLRDWFKSLGAAKVILADAGDFSQGSIYVSVSKGETAVEMLNAVGYDVVTLGNHEFDFGYAKLMENLKNATFTTVCADVMLADSGELILPAYTIIETEGGAKIAFVGMETPETATKVHPGMIKEISFATFDDLYASAQAAVTAAREEGADIVIGLWHLGVDDESKENGYRSVDVLSKVEGVDFVIDGHSHTVMTQGENGEPVQSTGTKFENVGVIVIDNETKTIEDHFLLSTASLEKDEAVAAKAQEIIDKVEAEYSTPFAKTEVELNGNRDPGNRTEETNLGDLITDAMVWYVTKEGGIEQAEPNHVLGVTNGGGIRATVAVGDVTMKDINSVLPFGNTVAVIYVTGEELLEALEASTFCTPKAVGAYPQTSGITWTLDTTKAYDQGELYIVSGKETSYYKPASIQRVTIQTVNGEAFDPAATYAVVTNDFLAAGGDTYAVFERAYQEGSGFNTGVPMDQAVMAYITEVLNGNITADAYGAPKGNETQIK